MSDRDRMILGSLVHALIGTCTECGCHGDHCTMPEGGKCDLPQVLGAACTAPACQWQAMWKKRRAKARQLEMRRRAR